MKPSFISKFFLSCALFLNLSGSGIAQDNTGKEILQKLDTLKKAASGHLPSLIEDKEIQCEIRINDKQDESENCYRELLQTAQNIFTCKENPIKANEMATYDAKLFDEMLKDNKKANIPLEMLKITSDLINTAIKLSPHTKNYKWKIDAYESKVLNAHAGADHRIMLSSGLWSKNSQLSFNETAAIIAHELSHIIFDHSLQLGCLAYEWTGGAFDLEFSLKTFREDFSVETPRGQAWSARSQNFEYEADKYATSLLKESGIDPYAMASALEKLKPKGSGGFSSGSHPEFDARIEAARRAAELTNKIIPVN